MTQNAQSTCRERRAQREILAKISRLALICAAEGGEIGVLRYYREQIKAGVVVPPIEGEVPEECWVLELGYRRLDEAWLDAELLRRLPRSLQLVR